MPVKETADQQLKQILEHFEKPCVYWAGFACIFPVEEPTELKWVLLDVQEA